MDTLLALKIGPTLVKLAISLTFLKEGIEKLTYRRKCCKEWFVLRSNDRKEDQHSR